MMYSKGGSQVCNIFLMILLCLFWFCSSRHFIPRPPLQLSEETDYWSRCCWTAELQHYPLSPLKPAVRPRHDGVHVKWQPESSWEDQEHPLLGSPVQMTMTRRQPGEQNDFYCDFSSILRRKRKENVNECRVSAVVMQMSRAALWRCWSAVQLQRGGKWGRWGKQTVALDSKGTDLIIFVLLQLLI